MPCCCFGTCGGTGNVFVCACSLLWFSNHGIWSAVTERRFVYPYIGPFHLLSVPPLLKVLLYLLRDANQPRFFNPAITTKIFPLSRNPERFHRPYPDPGHIIFHGPPYQYPASRVDSIFPKWVGKEEATLPTSTSSFDLWPPTQTFLGVRHVFLPHERLLNRKINSCPIVRKYQLVITCRLSKIQSALLKSKCWQAKHIRTSSVECDAWPKIFAPDENLGDK